MVTYRPALAAYPPQAQRLMGLAGKKSPLRDSSKEATKTFATVLRLNFENLA